MTATIAVVGLDYVDLPLSVGFGKILRAIGFNINSSQSPYIEPGIDPNGVVPAVIFSQASLTSFTADRKTLEKTDFFLQFQPILKHCRSSHKI